LRVIVVGATGTIGGAVVHALRDSHEVIAVSRSGAEPRVDLSDPSTVPALFEQVDDADAIVCCAASAPLKPIAELSHEGLVRHVAPKLFGQVGLAIAAAAHLNDGGSISLTSGKIPEQTAGSAPGALVNAGIEAFVRAAPIDLDRGVRINAVSPGWVSETLLDLGMDPNDGTPAREVARAYVEVVEGTMQGQVLRPGDS
jgi:NAD(P)-dependent dehydrogenase (short-subunit alcohol dehydrogenase family)